MSATVERSILPATNARTGVLLLLAGLGVFVGLNGAVKAQVEIFPVNQIIFFRNAMGLVPLLIFAAGTPGRIRPPRAWLRLSRARDHILAALGMSATLVCGYVAFARLPLSEATAIFFLQPLIVTALSAIVLREPVSLSAWLAVVGGFAGVLLMAPPTDIRADAGALFAIGAAAFSAVTTMVQRSLSRTESSLSIAIVYCALSSVLFLPSLLVSWVTPGWAQLGGLIAMGLFSGIGQYLMIRALAFATAATLAPAYYVNLLGGIVVGFVWFGEVPTPMVLAGSAMVVVSTLVVLRRPAPAPGA